MRDIIIAAATSGHVVIVGRGSQVLLADRRDVLHVRVIAPLELRVAYAARREGLDIDLGDQLGNIFRIPATTSQPFQKSCIRKAYVRDFIL